MEIGLPILLFVAGFGAGAFVIWLMKQRELEAQRKAGEELEAAFGDLSRKALLENQHQFLELAKLEFEKLQVGTGKQLEQKKELIDASLQSIERSLRALGEDTVGLREQMHLSQQRMENLNTTTGQLRSILSSNQARGQWGERMVEDILNFLGLVERVNFTKQT